MARRRRTDAEVAEPPKRTRRADGEGAKIRQQKDGRWRTYLTVNGTRTYVYGATQAKAKAKLDGLKEKVARNLPITSDKLTVGKYLVDWLENAARQSVRPNTLRGYRTSVTQYLIPRLGKIALVKLSAQDVRRFQNELLEAPRASGNGRISSGSVVNARRVLSRALQQAVEDGLIHTNPVRRVRGPRVTRKEIVPLDPDQAKQLLVAIRGERLEALFTVALALGLRRGEALGLMWQDIDFADGALHVRRALQRTKAGLELLDVKTRKSHRVVALPLFAVRALQQHRRRQDAEREQAANLWTERGLVFCTETGGLLDPQRATRGFTRSLKRAGLPHQRFHDLRHACASLLLAQGIELKVISEVLGHSTITITGDLYAHVLRGLKQKAAAEMDALLGDSDPEDEQSNVTGETPTSLPARSRALRRATG